MKRPAFIEGVVVALLASSAGSVLYGALGWLFPAAAVFRVLVALLALGYLLYLLARSGERIGRVSALLGWLLLAAVLWLLEPPLMLYLLGHVTAVWLIRSLYFHSGVLTALADLGLSLLGLAAAVWAATQTGSLFASLWCLFLVQALFVTIPADLTRKGGGQAEPFDGEDRFQHAYRAAESALRRLS